MPAAAPGSAGLQLVQCREGPRGQSQSPAPACLLCGLCCPGSPPGVCCRHSWAAGPGHYPHAPQPAAVGRNAITQGNRCMLCGLCCCKSEQGACCSKNDQGVCCSKSDQNVCCCKSKHGMCCPKSDQGMCCLRSEHIVCCSMSEQGVCCVLLQERPRHVLFQQ